MPNDREPANNPAFPAKSCEHSSALQRIDWFCEHFKIEKPALELDPDEPGEFFVTNKLVDWCRQEGVSLEWLISGDATPALSLHREINHKPKQIQAPKPKPTPVMAQFERWKQQRTAWEKSSDSGLEPSDDNKACGDVFAIADTILDIPSESPRDFIFKLMAYTFEGEHEIGDGAKGERLWAEAREFIGQEATQ